MQHPGGHYFEAQPESASRPAFVDLVLPDLTLRLAVDRGVFSPGRVDPGTKLLLLELPPPERWPPGPLVDLGSGYGPIACALALRDPTREVWAVEVNGRARELCSANAAASGVADRVHVVGPDEVPADLRPGMVVSNPPIRIGKPALHDLVGGWTDRLAPDGEAWLVVQKNLGADSLARWLADRGHVERVRSRQGYRVLRITTTPP